MLFFLRGSKTLSSKMVDHKYSAMQSEIVSFFIQYKFTHNSFKNSMALRFL